PKSAKPSGYRKYRLRSAPKNLAPAEPAAPRHYPAPWQVPSDRRLRRLGWKPKLRVRSLSSTGAGDTAAESWRPTAAAPRPSRRPWPGPLQSWRRVRQQKDSMLLASRLLIDLVEMAAPHPTDQQADSDQHQCP